VATDPRIRYDIEAGIKGEADVNQLAATLRALGDTLEGGLKTQALEAADALDQLGTKQRAVQEFSALKRETEGLTAELNTATTSVDRLAAELPQAAAATLRYAEAETRARTVAAGAKADLDEQRAALQALRTQYTGSARQTVEYKEASDQLKLSVKELTANLKQQSAAVTLAERATRGSQDTERNLATQYERSVDAAKKLSVELGNKSRALDATRSSLASYGIQTTQLVGAEKELAGAIAQVRTSVAGLAPAFAQAAQASSASAQRQAADQRTVRDGVRSIGDELRRIQTIATVAVGGSFLGSMVKDVAATADEFKNLQARIKLATGEGQAFDVAFAGVQRIALATNSSLGDTATLFARIAKAGTDAGLSSLAATQQSLGLVETINQAVQLSGSSADASAAAITQLIQGLQSGVLRGEEFNSVMEQAPRLAQALANGVGRTTGELRKMAEQGALTTEVVIRALTTQSATVAAEFGKLPATVGRALQNLQTQWSLYVGATDNGFVSSKNLALVIDGLARNLDTLVTTLYAAGKAWAAIKIAGLAADAYRWATATTGATVAIQANTAAVASNTVAHGANAAAQRSTALAAASTGAAMTGNTAKFASGAAILGRFSGLLGPFGIALAAVSPQIVELAQGLGEGVAKWQGYGKAIADAEGRMRAQEAAAQSNAQGQRLVAIALEEARNKQFELSKESQGLIGKFDELRTKGDSAAEAIGKIGRDFDLASIPGIAGAAAVLDKLVADGKLSATQFQDAWSTALKNEDLGVFEVKARAAFAGAAREGERIAAVLDGSAREAIRRTGLEFDTLAGGIGKAARSAINDTDAIANNLVRLQQAGVDTGLALTASIGKSIDTADSQKAIEAIRTQLASLRVQLGDRVTDGLLERASVQAEQLRLNIEKLKPGIQSVGEAFKFFGLQTGAELVASANGSREAYEALKTSGVASADQLRAAFERTAKDVTAANKGVPPSWLVIEDAIIRSREATERFGRTTEGTLGRLEGRWKSYGDTVRREGSATPGVIGPDNTAKPITSTTGNTREERLAGQNAVDMNLQFQTRERLRQGDLGVNDLGTIKTVIETLRQQNAINGSASKLSAGFMSLEGQRDAAGWQSTRAQLEALVKKLEAPDAPRSTKHEVELTMPGGATDTFNVESEADAQKLVGLLGRVKGRSS